MQSPKRLQRIAREPVKPEDRPVIFFLGSSKGVAEPLLLEALANNPACERLYFIPVYEAKNLRWFAADYKKHQPVYWNTAPRDLWKSAPAREGKPIPLRAYDLTEILARSGDAPPDSASIEATLAEAFKQPPITVLSTDADLQLSGTNVLAFESCLPGHHPGIARLNHPKNADASDDKLNLPGIGQVMRDVTGVDVIAKSQAVRSLDEIEHFMQTNDFSQIALKTRNGLAGMGVFRVWRPQPHQPLVFEHLGKDKYSLRGWKGVLPAEVAKQLEQGMLAVEWLEPSKGDIRAVILQGKCVGAYMRRAKEDSWLCNFSAGGTIEPVDLRHDLTRRDRKLLNAVARRLQGWEVNFASIDLLADAQGRRFLSEINVGTTDDLVDIHRHQGPQLQQAGRMPIAEQMATQILHSYRTQTRGERLWRDEICAGEMQDQRQSGRRGNTAGR